MKKNYQVLILIAIILIAFGKNTNAQYVSKKFKSKHEVYTDSLKHVEYNYVFPILGKGAYKKGFDIPYPIGIMTNFIWMDQGIDISNMQLGLKTDNIDKELTPVDFIGFGENRNTSFAFNFRPDIWVFPFLNVYGLFGAGKSRTEVNLNRLGDQPFDMKSIVEQGITTTGVGVMSAFGVGPVWFSVDANWTWNKPELLDKAVLVNVVGLRLGHTFVFKNHPDRNIAIWAGGMRVSMSSETVGEVVMKDALPPETWERRDEIVNNYNNWYDGLTPAKKALVDKTAVPEIADKLSKADGDAIIRYGMDKQVKEMWNGLVGVQFQLNKYWQFRSEAGIVGDRKSFLVSVNYRFLGFRTK